MSTNTNFTTMCSLDMYNNCTMKQIGVRVHIILAQQHTPQLKSCP